MPTPGRIWIVAILVVWATLLPASAAATIDHHDPSVFGPGESWPLLPLRPGSAGPWVAELQAALNGAGFRAGEVDGVFGAQTVAAVHAFQKVHGLERDAVFRPEHWELLDVSLPSPGVAGEADRVEIDLNRQVLFLMQESEVVRILPVSSANGATYVNYAGNLVRARTPEGRFRFNRQRSGWHRSYLGFMYAPFYFHGGYALHGSSFVPAYPASHGCVRVTIGDMVYLRQHLALGMPLYVYGRNVSREALLPTPPPPPPPTPVPDQVL